MPQISLQKPEDVEDIRPNDSVSQNSRRTDSSVANQQRLTEAQRLAELSAHAAAIRTPTEYAENKTKGT